jgi:hypothetical protein
MSSIVQKITVTLSSTNVQGSNLRPGIRKTCGPSEISSLLALTKAARLQKGYMLSGKEVYFCDYYLVLSGKINLGYVSQHPTLLQGDLEKEWKRYWA